MKTTIALAMGAAALYRVAKDHGINSFKDLKAFFASELKLVSQDIKHELVS